MCFKQRWFRARLQHKKFLQRYHSSMKVQHEVQERLSQRNRAASVIQKAVRRFLLCKKQEQLNARITKIQVTENVMILVQDFGLKFIYMMSNM